MKCCVQWNLLPIISHSLLLILLNMVRYLLLSCYMRAEKVFPIPSVFLWHVFSKGSSQVYSTIISLFFRIRLHTKQWWFVFSHISCMHSLCCLPLTNHHLCSQYGKGRKKDCPLLAFIALNIYFFPCSFHLILPCRKCLHRKRCRKTHAFHETRANSCRTCEIF